MPEMILPGTYIEVRAEGLIRPGPISIGNVGIVGTAQRGMLADSNDPETVYRPIDLGQAREFFGRYDPFDKPEEQNHPLTLVRAMELAYANGAQRVFAVRVADNASAQISEYPMETDSVGITIKAIAPGSGYDRAKLKTGPYTLSLNVSVLSGPGGVELEGLENLPRNPAEFASQVNVASKLFLATNSGDAPIAVGAVVTRTTDGQDAKAAVFALPAGTGSVRFTAKQPGTEMNSASINVANGADGDHCTVTIDNGTGTIEPYENVLRAPAGFIAALASSELFTLINDGADADINNDTINAPAEDGTAGVAAVFEIPVGSGSVQLTASARSTASNNWTVAVNGYLDVTFELEQMVEVWRDVPTAPVAFAQVINGKHASYNYRTKSSTGGGSTLFTVDAIGATGNVSEKQEPPTGEPSQQTSFGTNGATADSDEYKAGLDALLNQDVHIIVLAGQGTDLSDILIGHLENASGDLMKRERIGIIGSSSSTKVTDLVAPAQDEGRLVFVGPGVRVWDSEANREIPLPGTYTAAAVAGRISSLDPHFSPTNKTINARRLEKDFNGTNLEQLLLGRVLALERRNGTNRIVRGLTTSTNTAWSQITTRRIVDYARFGVRASANPFIGKLNNDRVRQALKGSVNSFLAAMIEREMLISYELDVSATRDQQIRGIAQVTMTLQPTFSIDYIRVVMYLK